LLKLRRGVVTESDPLKVRVGDQVRKAWADEGLLGEMRVGDEVIVNTEALDLGLGSGGYDVVHVNLTRGLDAPGAGRAPAMKLNYTSLQHPVDPVEASSDWDEPTESDNGHDTEFDDEPDTRVVPVLVLSLHGQLAPATWAARRGGPDLRVGYVQTTGGALPGGLSEDVAELRSTELLCGHVTAGQAYGGELEAVTVIGALQAAANDLEWDAVIAGPGPGISGSGSALGHGGLVALDTAHASLILGFETLLAPRMSSSDQRTRHRGLSHHTETVLRMLLGNVRVPAPAADPSPWPHMASDDPPLVRLRRACGDRHEVWIREAPVNEYAASGLSATHMGRPLAEDRLFFAAALAAGDGLAAAARLERVQ
jgi:hypothetical protein